MAEKYLPISPYAFVLNNPVILVQPNGMEVTAVAGGYQYTGADVSSALRFLTAQSKNVYVALIENNRLRKATNKNSYDQWNVIGVTSAAEASTLMAVKYVGKEGSLDNLIYEAHGGVTSKNKKNFFLTRIKGSEDPLTKTL